ESLLFQLQEVHQRPFVMEPVRHDIAIKSLVQPQRLNDQVLPKTGTRYERDFLWLRPDQLSEQRPWIGTMLDWTWNSQRSSAFGCLPRRRQGHPGDGVGVSRVDVGVALFDVEIGLSRPSSRRSGIADNRCFRVASGQVDP